MKYTAKKTALLVATATVLAGTGSGTSSDPADVHVTEGLRVPTGVDVW